MDEKEKAVKYITENKVDSILQQTLNSLYKKQPQNVFGYLAEELDKFASKPSIKLITGYHTKSLHADINRVVVEVTCTVQNHEEILESASIGFDCAEDAVDLDELKAINDALQGLSIFDQELIDSTLEKLEISAGMKLSVSSAVFKSSSRLQGLPITESFQHCYTGKGLKMPMPIVSIINCGKSGAGKNNMASLAVCPNLNMPHEKSMAMLETIYKAVEDLVKKKHHNNFCIAANGAFNLACDKPEQMIEFVKEAISEQELVPGNDFFFVLDCLASDFHTEVVPGQGSAKKGQTQSTSRHRYDWFEGQMKPTEDLCDFLEGLLEHEDIVALVDPLHHEDIEGYEILAKKLGSKCVIFSRQGAPHTSSVFKLNTTITHTITQLKGLDRPATLIEAANFEEGETMLADLALVSGCGFVMLGGFRGVRGKLYNRVSKLVQQKGPVANVLSEWGFKEVVEEDGAAEAE